MKLVLIRHGETHWNNENRIHGWLDSPLTEQAKSDLSALTLPALHQPLLYSSDLGRAHDSANIIANKMGLDVILDKRLRERNFGILQGKIINHGEALQAHWLKYHRRYITPLIDIPGIESELDFSTRINDFFRACFQHDDNRDIIIVSHGEWLRGLSNIIDGIPCWHQGRGIPVNVKLLIYRDV